MSPQPGCSPTPGYTSCFPLAAPPFLCFASLLSSTGHRPGLSQALGLSSVERASLSKPIKEQSRASGATIGQSATNPRGCGPCFFRPLGVAPSERRVRSHLPSHPWVLGCSFFYWPAGFLRSPRALRRTRLLTFIIKAVRKWWRRSPRGKVKWDEEQNTQFSSVLKKGKKITKIKFKKLKIPEFLKKCFS